MKWNWQDADWPNFRYAAANLISLEQKFLQSEPLQPCAGLQLLGIGAWLVAAAIGIWLLVWGGGSAEFFAPATAVIAFCIYAAGLTQARRSWFLAAG